MRKPIIIFFVLLSFLFSCSDHTKHSPQTETETATQFIRNVLDNKLEEAEQYLLKDEENKQYFDIIKEQYKKKTKDELAKYKNADIIINEISKQSDSVSIVNYSNSYKREARNTVKVVRSNGKWLIDLKYTFTGNL